MLFLLDNKPSSFLTCSPMMSITLFNVPAIYIFLGLAFLLPKIPVVGKFFNVINTLIHELGHALFALPFDGVVKKIELFNDTSGTTTTQCKSKVGSFFVSIAGYLFAALFAYFAFFLISVGYHKGFIITITLIAFFTLLLWIRNSYGVIWVLIFTALNSYLIYNNNEYYLQLIGLLYATFIGVEALSSSFVVLYLSIFRKGQAGDATILAKSTKIPAFIWGVLFASISLYMSYLIVLHFFKLDLLKLW